jgi:hypothetical protein
MGKPWWQNTLNKLNNGLGAIERSAKVGATTFYRHHIAPWLTHKQKVQVHKAKRWVKRVSAQIISPPQQPWHSSKPRKKQANSQIKNLGNEIRQFLRPYKVKVQPIAKAITTAYKYATGTRSTKQKIQQQAKKKTVAIIDNWMNRPLNSRVSFNILLNPQVLIPTRSEISSGWHAFLNKKANLNDVVTGYSIILSPFGKGKLLAWITSKFPAAARVVAAKQKIEELITPRPNRIKKLINPESGHIRLGGDGQFLNKTIRAKNLFRNFVKKFKKNNPSFVKKFTEKEWRELYLLQSFMNSEEFKSITGSADGWKEKLQRYIADYNKENFTNFDVDNFRLIANKFGFGGRIPSKDEKDKRRKFLSKLENRKTKTSPVIPAPLNPTLPKSTPPVAKPFQELVQNGYKDSVAQYNKKVNALKNFIKDEDHSVSGKLDNEKMYLLFKLKQSITSKAIPKGLPLDLELKFYTEAYDARLKHLSILPKGKFNLTAEDVSNILKLNKGELPDPLNFDKTSALLKELAHLKMDAAIKPKDLSNPLHPLYGKPFYSEPTTAAQSKNNITPIKRRGF